MSSIDWSNLDVLAAVRAELQADQQQQQQLQQQQQSQQQQWNFWAPESNAAPRAMMIPPQTGRQNSRRASLCSTSPSSLLPTDFDKCQTNLAQSAAQSTGFQVSAATSFFDDPSANNPFGPSVNTRTSNGQGSNPQFNVPFPSTPKREPGGALPTPRTHLERDVNQAMPATELSLQCPVCGFAFPNAVALNSHIQTAHNVLRQPQKPPVLNTQQVSTSVSSSPSPTADDFDSDDNGASPLSANVAIPQLRITAPPGTRHERDRSASVSDPLNSKAHMGLGPTVVNPLNFDALPIASPPTVSVTPNQFESPKLTKSLFANVEGSNGVKMSQSLSLTDINSVNTVRRDSTGNATSREGGSNKGSPTVVGNKIMLGRRTRLLEQRGTVHFGNTKATRPAVSASSFKDVVFPPVKRQLTTEDKVVIVQSFVRRWLVRKEVKPELTRSKIVHEILNTEITYLKSLGDIMCTFVSPLQEALKRGKPIVSVEDVQLFAGEFQPIINFNTQFLAALKKRVGNWQIRACISDLFVALDNRVMIETYARYTVMMNTVLDRFSMLRKTNAAFNKFVTTCEKSFWDEAHSGSSFQSFLILPIQRPPRYLLLLRELRKCTSKDHPDSPMLDIALENFERLCYQLNEKQRSRDDETARQEELLTVAQKIDPPLVQLTDSSTRRFRKELDAHHLNSERKIVSSRHIFLFTDVLLLTKFRKRSGRYTLKNIISVSSEAKVEDLVGPCEFLGKSFPAVMQIQSKEGLFMISFNSTKDKDDFIKEIKECQNYLELLDMEFE